MYRIKQIAENIGATPAQVALAWIHARQEWIVPIPGTTKINRLEENVGAVNVTLSSNELTEIRDAIEKIEIQGNRYPESSEKMIDNN